MVTPCWGSLGGVEGLVPQSFQWADHGSAAAWAPATPPPGAWSVCGDGRSDMAVASLSLRVPVHKGKGTEPHSSSLPGQSQGVLGADLGSR